MHEEVAGRISEIDSECSRETIAAAIDGHFFVYGAGSNEKTVGVKI
jgi:hypothetical protein